MPSTIKAAPLTCSSCEGEIAGRPEFHVGLAFCCAGCVVGGPCTCSYDPEIVEPFTDAEWELVVERVPVVA